MPTMIQKYQCNECQEVYADKPDAVDCADRRAAADGYDASVLGVYPLDLWECDGEDCQNVFDDQWSAQACETGHETAGAEGRQGLDIGAMGDSLNAQGLTQAGRMFTRAARP